MWYGFVGKIYDFAEKEGNVVSNTAEINETIANLVADLFTEDRQRLFRYASETELGYTRAELDEVKKSIRDMVLENLTNPTRLDTSVGATPPYTRSYMHSQTYISDVIECALLEVDGHAYLEKWHKLLPTLQVRVENDSVYTINLDGNSTWVGGELEELDEVAEDLNRDVAKWSSDGEKGKIYRSESQLQNVVTVKDSKIYFAHDLGMGQKFSLTPNGCVYKIVDLNYQSFSGYSDYIKFTVLAKKWRKVKKLIQKVGNRTTKDTIDLNEKTRERVLCLAMDRRIYPR
jgi:hypothetical protein